MSKETIEDLSRELARLQGEKQVLVQRQEEIRRRLDELMRPVYVLRGKYTHYRNTVHRHLGYFSSFAGAYEAQKLVKSTRQMLIIAIPQEELVKGVQIDGPVDDRGYVSE